MGYSCCVVYAVNRHVVYVFRFEVFPDGLI